MGFHTANARIKQRIPAAVLELCESFEVRPVAIWTYDNEVEIYLMEKNPSEETLNNFESFSQSMTQ